MNEDKIENKISSEEIKNLLSTIDDLIEIKVIIRKTTPQYDLNKPLSTKFVTLLDSIQKKLNPIFGKYLDSKKLDESKRDIKAKIFEIVENINFLLVSSESTKKKLKNIGVDARQIIVTGGPLSIEDYKVVNPNIPEKALEGIKKKISRILLQIEKEDWNQKSLTFIYEKENITDKLILSKINDISSKIGNQIKTFEINSWNQLNI